MKIAFAGAQSSGKTTLLNMMREDPVFAEYEFYDNITRNIQAEGYSINEDSNSRTQFRIADSHDEILETAGDNFIADRSMLDCYVYSQYLFEREKLPAEDIISLTERLLAALPKYDIIFYLRPEFGLIEDGTRSSDKQFQEDIAEIFDIVVEAAATYVKIVPLTGPSPERFKQIKEELKCE